MLKTQTAKQRAVLGGGADIDRQKAYSKPFFHLKQSYKKIICNVLSTIFFDFFI